MRLQGSSRFSVVLQKIEQLSAGIWEICHHNCQSEDHAHPVWMCDKEVTGKEEGTIGVKMFHGFDNPCAHYADIDANHDFRLAVICEDRTNAALNVIVRRTHGPFDKVNYMALSYRCGDLCDVQQIYLNHIYRYPNEEAGKPGICVQHSFNITKRLQQTLCHIRNHGVDLSMWIDAICIDQRNTAERSCQVKHMGKIYAHAAFTQIWLDSELIVGLVVRTAATRSVQTLKQRFSDEFSGRDMEEKHMRFLHYIRLHIEDDSQLPISALNQFFSNPWFSTLR